MGKYVELLEDVAEGGRSLKRAQEAADAFGLGKSDPKYPRLKETLTGRGHTRYVKGLVIFMTDDGAKKWADRGLCKVVSKPAEKIVEVEARGADGKPKLGADGKPVRTKVDASTAKKLVALKQAAIV